MYDYAAASLPGYWTSGLNAVWGDRGPKTRGLTGRSAGQHVEEERLLQAEGLCRRMFAACRMVCMQPLGLRTWMFLEAIWQPGRPPRWVVAAPTWCSESRSLDGI